MKDLPFFKDQFIPNFDGTETEPTFLPFQVPNILVSGSTGIAVGMATNIPTHNLGEVIDATVAYLNDPEIQLEDLLALMPGPDFATGGIINATPEELYNVYATGLGKIKVRGKVDIIFSGAGLPLDLPSFLKKDSVTKLVPIVSSARAVRIICEK